MRPSCARLVTLVARSTLPKSQKVLPALKPFEKVPTVHDILLERKAKSTTPWPQNLRIEPYLEQAVLKGVEEAPRGVLKKTLRKLASTET